MSDIGMTVGLIKALGSPDPAVIEGAVSDWLDDHPEATTTVEDGAISYAKLNSSLQGTVDDVGDLKTEMTNQVSINQALITVLQNVVYSSSAGEAAYQALYNLIYPQPELLSISATFDNTRVVYDWDDVSSLRDYLTVTAHYDGGTSEIVTDYTLSGSLSVGNNTITIAYGGKTTTVTVLAYGFVFTNSRVNSINNDADRLVRIKENTKRIIANSTAGVTALKDEYGDASAFYAIPIRPDFKAFNISYGENYRRVVLFDQWSESFNDFVQAYSTGWSQTSSQYNIPSEYRSGEYYLSVSVSGPTGNEDMSQIDTSGWSVTPIMES